MDATAPLRGRPLGLVSTGKRVTVPKFLLRVDSLLPRSWFGNASFEPVISSWIPDADRRAIAYANAIRSATPVVPAPGGSQFAAGFSAASAETGRAGSGASRNGKWTDGKLQRRCFVAGQGQVVAGL